MSDKKYIKLFEEFEEETIEQRRAGYENIPGLDDIAAKYGITEILSQLHAFYVEGGENKIAAAVEKMLVDAEEITE